MLSDNIFPNPHKLRLSKVVPVAIALIQVKSVLIFSPENLWLLKFQACHAYLPQTWEKPQRMPWNQIITDPQIILFLSLLSLC